MPKIQKKKNKPQLKKAPVKRGKASGPVLLEYWNEEKMTGKIFIVLILIFGIYSLFSFFTKNYMNSYCGFFGLSLLLLFICESPWIQKNGFGSRVELCLLACLTAVGIALLMHYVQFCDTRCFASDEWDYMAQALVIKMEHHIQTHAYHWNSVASMGLPLANPHVPGNTLLIALSYWLFGVSEESSVFMSKLLYVLIPTLLFFLGKKIGGVRIGVAAVLLFLSFPYFTFFANTAMADIPYCFFFLLMLLILFHTQEWEWKSLMALSLVMIANLLVRESNIVYLPLLLVVLFFRAPTGKKIGVLFKFLIFVGLMAVLIMYPLSLRRESFAVAPLWSLQNLLSSTEIQDIKNNIVFNINLLKDVRLPIWGWMRAAFAIIFLIPLLMILRKMDLQKKLFYFSGYLFLIALFTVIMLFYYSGEWVGLHVMMIVPIPFFILCSLTLLDKGLPVYHQVVGGIVCVALACFLFWVGNNAFLENRGYWIADEHHIDEQEQMVDVLFKDPQPRLGMAPYFLSLPWRRYPTQVIWTEPDNAEDFQKLDKVVNMDFLIIPFNDGLLNVYKAPKDIDKPNAKINWVINGDFRYEGKYGIYYYFTKIKDKSVL